MMSRVSVPCKHQLHPLACTWASTSTRSMLGANAAAGCQPAAALDTHFAVAEPRNSDRRAPAAARSSGACSPGASGGCPAACRRGPVAEGGVAGWAPPVTRRARHRQRRSHHCRPARERSSTPSSSLAGGPVAWTWGDGAVPGLSSCPRPWSPAAGAWGL